SSLLFQEPAPPAPSPLSLHDALPILRVPVAGGPALQDVRDEDVLPLQPDSLEQLGEEATGAADERQPGAVLLRARSLADEHQVRSEEHTSELQSLAYLVCRLLLEKKK